MRDSRAGLRAHAHGGRGALRRRGVSRGGAHQRHRTGAIQANPLALNEHLRFEALIEFECKVAANRATLLANGEGPGIYVQLRRL